MRLAGVDYLIMFVYLAFVLGIGFALKRVMKSSMDFFLSGRSIPAWIAGLAFLSANLGAQEVIGMGASGAKYGIATSHFYWIGAIPAMVFVGLFMMPFYYGSRARSVPEYLKLRFDEKTRGFNAISFAVMTVCSSGISMMVMGKLFNLLLGWDMDFSIWLSAIIVLLYISLGGLTSAIYNEVLQFFLIVFGFLPLSLLGLRSVGGWSGLKEKLAGVAVENGYAAGALTSSWQHMGSAAENPIGVEVFGLAMGLGFVLSFGYWCTDFLVVQRAMAADSMAAARRTPLIAAVPKMLFPFLVILPGMVALVAGSNLTRQNVATAQADSSTVTMVTSNEIADRMALGHKGIIPVEVETPEGQTKPQAKTDKNGKPVYDYNLATPMMLLNFFPSGLLGLGLAALLASFMSGMAGNVTAFNTVWTYDIYQSYINKNASDHHYLWMGRFTTIWGTLLSVAAAYMAMRFNNIMDVLQLVFGYVNAPLFATFFLGMFWARTTGHGAFLGLLSGTLAAFVHHGITLPAGAEAFSVKGGFLGTVVHTYPSEMAQNFWMAIWAFTTCFSVTILVSLVTRPRAAGDLQGLVYSLTPKPKEHGVPWYKQPATLAIVVLAATVALNLVFF
jgi:SSS family solute:Na+ symporter